LIVYDDEEERRLELLRLTDAEKICVVLRDKVLKPMMAGAGRPVSADHPKTSTLSTFTTKTCFESVRKPFRHQAWLLDD
jgi:hypothetical protein